MEQDFGVWVNNELKWSDQCGKAAGKAMYVLGVIVIQTVRHRKFQNIIQHIR